MHRFSFIFLLICLIQILGCSKSSTNINTLPPPPPPPILNVYVGGRTSNGNESDGTIWKNDSIQSDFSQFDVINSIFVSGDDVYAAGKTSDGTSQISAAYWENGKLVVLTDSTVGADANSIAVSGNDIYVVGDENDHYIVDDFVGNQSNMVARFWKNGSSETLKVKSGFSTALSIAVSDSDVYIIGVNSDPPSEYWKNGTPVTLTKAPLTGFGSCIFLSNH